WNGGHRMRTAANIYCMPVRPFAATSGLKSVRWRRYGHQANEHSIELVTVEVKLDFDFPRAKLWLGIRSPSQGISVGRTAVEINGHQPGFALDDDARVDPRCGSQLIPHDVCP